MILLVFRKPRRIIRDSKFEIQYLKFEIRDSISEIRNSISKTTNQEKAFKLRILYANEMSFSIISYRTNKKEKETNKTFFII
jgi:hypothetical protein